MPVQTSVAERPNAGQPGQVADSGFNDVVSGVASEPIAFGLCVVKKATGWEIAAAAADFSGEWGVAIENPTNPTQTGYVAGDSIAVLKSGRVFVTAGVAMNIGDDVRVTAATGVFTDTAAAGNTVLLDGARVVAGGTVAQIDITSQANTAD